MLNNTLLLFPIKLKVDIIIFEKSIIFILENTFISIQIMDAYSDYQRIFLLTFLNF